MDNLITVPASNFLHNEENISSYCEGGFHPVQLGDHFKGGRYEVVHKLGWGGFSTAWLAKDKTFVALTWKAETYSNRLVATSDGWL